MNRISGARFLVTGGAGFVGSAIVDQLLDAGAAEVRVLDNFIRGTWSNLSPALETGRTKVIEGDVRDTESVDRACEGVDYVFHEAALRITQCADVPRDAVDVLIGGTVNVLESALRHGIKKIVAASSASVYGEPSYLPIDEAHPFNNRTVYGAGKIAGEQLLRAYFTASALPYVAFRYFNVYGPRMDTVGVYTEVMIRWLNAIEANQPPLIFGTGEQSMDFVYVGDVARANLLAIQSDVTDEAFNIGTGVQTSLKELCDLMLKLNSSSLKPEYREGRKVGNVQARRASVEKAKRMLGFSSEVALGDGLTELIRWKRAIKTVPPVAVEAL